MTPIEEERMTRARLGVRPEVDPTYEQDNGFRFMTRSIPPRR
jgi:hypothetical protein